MKIGTGIALTGISPGGGGRPSLDLNLLAALDPRITFTRASSGTHFDSTGRLVTDGYNLLTYSSTFTNAAWTKTDVTPTLGESSPLDVGYLMTEGSAGSAWTVQTGAAVTAGSTITGSVVLKRGNTDWVRVVVGETTATDGANAWFNLNTGAKGATSARGAGTAISSTITSLGGGWYRCAVTVLPNGSYTLGQLVVLSASADSSTSRVANATYTVSAAQLERSSTVSQYSPTTTAANSGPRFDYDPAVAAGVTGGELVTNGDFSNGTTGWNSNNGSSLSVVNGALRVTNGGAFGGAQRSPAIGLTVGKRYRVMFDYLGGTSTAVSANTVSGQVIGPFTTTPGTKTADFVALSGNIFFFIDGTIGNYGDFDNISVQELTFTPRGLLIEEQRTNLLLHSRDMTQAAWSKTDVTAARTQVGIDGVASSACLMTEGSAGTAFSFQTATVSAGSTVTGSFVLKRGNNDWFRVLVWDNVADGYNTWINLNTGALSNSGVIGAGTGSASVTNLGGGWYRVTITATPNGVYTTAKLEIRSAAAAGSGTRVANATYIVECAQLEVGAFATSPIVTGAATATRAVDSASMTGTNFSSWFNASAGTFVAEYMPGSADGFVFDANDGTTSNRTRLFRAASPGTAFAVDSAGVNQANITTTLSPSLVVAKTAGAYSANDFAVCNNGGTVFTDVSGNVAVSPIRLDIGARQGGSSLLNGHIRSIRFYSVRLSNAQLQSLTL